MRQSIINKGVEVPEDVMIEDLPGYIAQITIKPADPTIPNDDGTEFGTIYTTDHPEGLALASLTEFSVNMAFGYNRPNITVQNNAYTIPLANVTGFSFGKQCKVTPAWFLCNCPNLTKLECMGGLTEIGSNFLASATSFSQDVTLSANLTKIAAGFLDRCSNYTGLLTINTSTIPGVSWTLATNDSTKPMYTQGVRIAGPGAAAWKAALPDSTNPYRKLILEGA